MEVFSYLLIITLSALVYFRNYLRAIYLCYTLKGPPALPILGNCLTVKSTKDMVRYGNSFSQNYGPIARCWISLVPFVFVYEPRHLKIIMGNNKVSKKNVFYGVLHNFLGEGLITSNDYAWKKNRRLLQPYFNTNMIEKYIHFFSDKAQDMVRNVNGYKEVKITTFINSCVLSILHSHHWQGLLACTLAACKPSITGKICRKLIPFIGYFPGAVLGEPLDNESPYRQGEVLLVDRIVKPWLLLDSIFKLTNYAEKETKQKLSLHQYTKKIFLKRCAQTDRVKDCLLDILIDISKQNKEFTVDDIINETVTLMLAGQDSVGATLAFAFFFLAKNEDIQAKVVEEMKNVTSSELTAEDLNNMKYLEQVLKETMRLAPVIPIISRVLNEDVNLDGTILPSGLNLFISPFITHRLPHVYPNPEIFDPDRFSVENLDKIHPYAFIPFSIGPRMCIGYKYAMLEMKTIIYHFLKAYSISTVPGFDELIFSYRISLRAKGGVRIRLNKR